jgi:hypothetical protein
MAGGRTVVCWFEDEGDDVGRFFDTAYHAVRACRLRWIHVRLLVQPRFLGDELESKQPIDLAPGGGDFRCHGVAENLTDRGEQVLTDDCGLLRAYSQRDVFVGDSVHDVVE